MKLVEGFLAVDQLSLRNQVLARYSGFLHSLLQSPSLEVRLLANVVARDPSSNTADNISYIKNLTNLSPWDYTSARIKRALPALQVPDKEKWRLGLLQSLFKLRNEKHSDISDTKRVTSMIDSLCST